MIYTFLLIVRIKEKVVPNRIDGREKEKEMN